MRFRITTLMFLIFLSLTAPAAVAATTSMRLLYPSFAGS